MKHSLLFAVYRLLVANGMMSVTSSFAQCANSGNIYSFSYGGKNYEIIKENKTWTQASQCAVQRGGYLVQIDSIAEQNAIYNAIIASGISPSYNPVSDGGSTSYLWLGATDKTNEGTWLWDGDNNNIGVNFWNGQGAAGTGTGAAVSGKYINWGGKSIGTIQEPDDYNANQDAAAIALTGWPYGTTFLGIAGEWNDIDMNNSIYYIIEDAAANCNITVSSNVTICPGNCATLNASFSPACSSVSYLWYPSVALSNTNISNPVACLSGSTTYTVIACCNSPSCCDTGYVTVNVLPPQTGPIITGPDSICAGQSATLCASGCVNYFWNTGSSNWCITVSPPFISAYIATCINANGCNDSSSHTLFVDSCFTGIAENNISNLIAISPNPTSGLFTIVIANEGTPFQIMVYNVMGEKAYAELVSASSSIIDLNSLLSGIYFIHVKTEQRTVRKKLIIQK